MPKIIKQPTPSKPTPLAAAVPKRDLLALGTAVALRDLAEERGMSVADVAGFPDLLTGAGLPAKIDDAVCRMAHRMHRDQIDAALWRADDFDAELDKRKARLA